MGAWGYLKSRPILIALLALVAVGGYQAANGNIKTSSTVTPADCGAALSEARAGAVRTGDRGVEITLRACKNAGILSEADVTPFIN